MCTVEYYGVVYPDGSIDRKPHYTLCRRGTRSSPCNNLQYDNDSYDERPATEEEIRDRMEPHYHVIEPSPESSSRSEATPRESKPKGILRKIFGSKDKAKSQTKPSVYDSPRANETAREPRSDGSKKSTADPPTARRHPREVKINNPPEKKKHSSSFPGLGHGHRQRPPSPVRDSELDRARLREEERQRQKEKQQSNDKAAKKQEEAQARAQKLHYEEQQQQRRQQDQAGVKGEGKTRRNGRPASYHAIPDEQLTDEQMRAQQNQYERDWESIRHFDRIMAQQQQEEEDRRTRHESEGRHAWRPVENSELPAWQRKEDEKKRRKRQREAGIPRQPRHPTVIDDIRSHDREDLDQQGADVIKSAMRSAEAQDAERRAPPHQWGLPIRGHDGLMRRNTVDGSQREERNGRQRRSHKREGRSG